MAYKPTVWVDGETPVNAKNLNKLEGGVAAAIEAGGLSDTAANLLVTILRNGVYSSDQSANITALAAELAAEKPDEPVVPDGPDNPEVTLSSISATYSGGDVAVDTAVTDLTGIVVTARYSDGSTATVTDYTLSGEIVEGNNTITVSYGGKTTTFTVTGVAEHPATVYELGSKKYGIPTVSTWTDESGTTIDAPDGSGGIYFLSNETFESNTDLTVEFAYTSTMKHLIYIGSYDGNTVNKTRVIDVKQYPEGTNFTEKYSVNAGCQLVVGFGNAVSPAITVTGV